MVMGDGLYSGLEEARGQNLWLFSQRLVLTAFQKYSPHIKMNQQNPKLNFVIQNYYNLNINWLITLYNGIIGVLVETVEYLLSEDSGSNLIWFVYYIFIHWLTIWMPRGRP